ncbi:hypothetical protein [Ralstonia phage RP31]|uniref:Uncharacterized protein n=2 Tax=Ripduovirus RP12 TaxID=2560700 RepID=A0A1L7N0W9_9CAUD|nr:hypothetical protein FDH28_gp277 [Ralstonia phage RP12]BAW19118.1 hypothetical protein [Ralstonia phage RP12]BAW19404.1 hypothetical protein [Ralstonia phage RP31]
MCEDACSEIPMQERLKFQSYQMLYRNVRNRLCRQTEVLPFDFLTSQHEDSAHYPQRYRRQPMQYICRERIGLDGNSILESRYLVAAGKERVVLLRDPDQALVRGQAFLLVWDGSTFKPHEGNAVDYWQTYIEPVFHESENVLTGGSDSNFGSMAIVRDGFRGLVQSSSKFVQQYHGFLMFVSASFFAKSMNFLDTAALPWLA